MMIGTWFTRCGNAAAASLHGRRDVPADLKPEHEDTDAQHRRRDREREYEVLLSCWM